MANKTKSTDTVLVKASVFPIADAETGEIVIELGKTGYLPKPKADLLIQKHLAELATADISEAALTEPNSLTGV